jgi:virginiamycin A acetyltransferase
MLGGTGDATARPWLEQRQTGEKAMVLDGVVIGSGAVVAAGAVVAQDVEPYAVVGGVPARVIKYRFSEDVRKQLLETQWCDKSEEWRQEHSGPFADPQEFLVALKEEHHEE